MLSVCSSLCWLFSHKEAHDDCLIKRPIPEHSSAMGVPCHFGGGFSNFFVTHRIAPNRTFESQAVLMPTRGDGSLLKFP